MSPKLHLALHPVPELERFDTSLRYTDILFGFVIRELFLRLQNWSQLDREVKLHLLVGITLVLGSWIGYRRSLYRSHYQVKFFNLPFFRFINDQVMLILYFRIAVLTDQSGKQVLAVGNLAGTTIKLVLYVFILYAVWDVLGMWIAKAKTPGKGAEKKPLYPEIINSQMSDKEQPINWRGFSITLSGLGLIVLTWCVHDCFPPNGAFLAIVTLLLLYRWAKEVRTSWQLPPRA
jgi:hypothetical protein